MNANDICRLIESDRDINFIGRSCSVLQINAINVAILYLESLGIELHGFIFRQQSETLTAETFEKNYYIQRNGIKYINVEKNDDLEGISLKEKIDLFSNILHLKNKQVGENSIYVISSNIIYAMFYACLKVYGTDKGIVFVEIDDGIENYLNRHKELLYKSIYGFMRTHRFIATEWINRAVSDFPYSILRFELKKKSRYISSLMLCEKRGRIYGDNKPILELYHNVLDIGISDNLEHHAQLLKDSILVVGDDVNDIDIINMSLELCKSYKTKIVFKPHPRDLNIERYKNLGIDVFDESNYSLELIIGNICSKPYAIIGEMSTCLLTCKALFQIPTISICMIMKYNKNQKLQMKMASLFFRTFSKYISIPKSKEEFALEIQDIVTLKDSDQ